MTENSIPEIKWIYAQRINGGKWIKRFISVQNTPTPLAESRMMDETAIGQMKVSEFAIFRNRPGWQNHRPYRLIDCRDKSSWPIRGLEGLINSMPSTLL